MISQEEFEEIVVNVLERDISSNEDQKKAILSRPDESLFLVAGPGSGKTTVMVLKILKFIFVDDINPSEILATTFTKKAAEELYSRILGWGDQIKNHIADNTDDFDVITQIIRIDFNQIQVGTTDKLAENIMKEHKEPGTKPPYRHREVRFKLSHDKDFKRKRTLQKRESTGIPEDIDRP